MNRHFNKFLDVISQQTTLYKELGNIAKQKQDIIINSDLLTLEAITKKEQGFVKAIMRLEEERVEALDNYCTDKNIMKVDTLNELVVNFDELERRQFNIKRDDLMEVLADLQETNELNTALLNQSLEYVNFSISVMNSFGLEDEWI